MLKKIIIPVFAIFSTFNAYSESFNLSEKTQKILEESKNIKQAFIDYKNKNNSSIFNPKGNKNSIEDFRSTLSNANLNFTSPIKNPYYDYDGAFGLIEDSDNLYLVIQSDIKTLTNEICNELNKNNMIKTISPFTLTESLNYLKNDYSCFTNNDNNQNLFVYKIY